MTESDFLTLSKKKFASWKLTDVDEFSEMFDDHGLVFGAGGQTKTKGQMIEDLRTKACQFKDINLKNTIARVFGSSAVVHGEGDFTLSESGETKEVQMNFLDVWVEREKGWRLISSHYTMPA